MELKRVVLTKVERNDDNGLPGPAIIFMSPCPRPRYVRGAPDQDDITCVGIGASTRNGITETAPVLPPSLKYVLL